MRKSRWVNQDRLGYHKESFFKKAYPEPNTGCWLWSGALTGGGYGSVKYDDIKYAHRFSYFIHFGGLDVSMCVLHKCDVRCCVNPEHLFIGTYRDNAIDRENKGRGNLRYGEFHGQAKLTDELVSDIRRMYKSGITTQRQLASIYGVDQAKIWNVIHKKSWAHVD